MLRRALLLTPLVLAAARCASPDPAIYTLRAVPGEARAGGPSAVKIARPGLAGYLDRSEIVRDSAANRLALRSGERWGEPLGDMIGRVIAEDLTQRLPGSSVFDQSGAITANPDARVEIDILKFDPAGDGTIVLSAEYAIEAGSSHHPIAARHVSLSAVPSGPGAGALAAAESGLLGTLADQIAHDAVQTPPPT